ncbi:MAG: hypothetical protein NVS9B13_04380 [Candidatus Acidiferrum sp.]
MKGETWLREVSGKTRLVSGGESVWGGLPTTEKRIRQAGYSFADQALAVGGMFVANVALARTQSKEEYGLFALSYSIYLFLAGLHNAVVVEPYTVYGAGRYREEGSGYLRLMAKSNLLAGSALGALLLLVCGVLQVFVPARMPKALLGMGLAITFLLSGVFLRRAFYVQARASQAAKASLIFFVTVVAGVWLAKATGRLDGFSVFLILGLGWLAAILGAAKQFSYGQVRGEVFAVVPNYWGKHWEYARWSLGTAFLAQLVLQGYYWLIAGLLSVTDVANLRAMTLLIAPAEQVFIALNYLVLPRLATFYGSGRREEFLRLWKLYAVTILGVTGCFVAAIRLAGLPAIHFLYAGKFDGLFPMLTMLAFLPLVMGAGHTINAALKAMERPKLVFYGYGCSGAVGAVGGAPLVAHFGVRGAVYGMLLAAAAYTAALAAGFWLALREEEKRETKPEGWETLRLECIAADAGTARTAASDNKATAGLAPIALFVYNRVEHTRRTVESLRANDLAAESDLYVFSDGAKTSADDLQVRKVREYLRTIDGFRSVKLVERDHNAGLANSVIEGVTQLCEERGRLIAMEDDLLTTADFLTFMNQALVRYESEPRIFSVSGFNFALRAPEGFSSDVFCFYRSSSLGWGTWRDRWEKADWTVADYAAFSADSEQRRKFQRGGEDLPGMLALQMEGWIDSWAIRWAYQHFRHDALALLSLRPRVFHIGADGTGTHARKDSLKQLPLTAEHKTTFYFPEDICAVAAFAQQLRGILRPSRARRVLRYLRKAARERRGLVPVSSRTSTVAAKPRPNQKEQGLIP